MANVQNTVKIASETLKKEYKEMGPVAYWTLYGGVKKAKEGAKHEK